MIGAGPSGHARDVHVVDRPAQGLGRPLQGLELDAHGVEVTHHGAPPGPQGRPGGVGDHRLAHEGARRLDRLRRHVAPHVQGMGQQLGRLAHCMGDATQLASQPGDDPGGAALGVLGFLHLAGRLGLGGPAAGGRRVRLQVDEAHRHAQAADAVGHCVVQLGQQGGPASLQSVHHGELPEGPSRVEGVLGHQRGQVEKLALATGLRQGDVAHVVVEIELLVAHPLRGGQRTGGDVHPLPQAGHVVERTLYALP